MASVKSDHFTATAKVTKVGNSLGLILSKDVLAKLNVGLGDSLFLVQKPDGYHLTPYDPDFEKQMSVATGIMKRDRDILRELAK